VYVADFGTDAAPGATVSVIDTETRAVVATVAVGHRPTGVAATPDGRFAYVTSVVSRSVSVIDTATRTVTATVPVDDGPPGVAAAPDGRHAYLTSAWLPGTVTELDTATNTVSARITTGAGAWSLAVSPDGRQVYVANYGTDVPAATVSVIDTATAS